MIGDADTEDTTARASASGGLTLRDRLAMRRTALAGERTVLAYARTAIMLVASGVTLLKLGPSGPVDITLASAAITAGFGVAIAAWRRAVSTRRALHAEAANG
ncbi:MAG: DUF202 domain-containing protein [Planctomycetota bacterium]